MTSIAHTLRLLADPIRLRILFLLEREELSVAELQEILSLKQSRLSMHLSQLKQTGLVEDRRSGKNILYRGANGDTPAYSRAILDALRKDAKAVPEAAHDARALDLILRKRSDKVRQYFDELAGKFGRAYVPGRSWKGLAETLLKLLPPLVIADLGAGEGTFSQLLAQRAKHVIAVDNSEKMVLYGSDLARKHNVKNLEYRLGDLESPPIPDQHVDLAFFSQALHHAIRPQKAVEQAYRILKPGGRVVILDLLRHSFEQARELYADVWLGFAEVELDQYLRRAGFRNAEITLVHKEDEPPHLETILAIAEKPAPSARPRK